MNFFFQPSSSHNYNGIIATAPLHQTAKLIIIRTLQHERVRDSDNPTHFPSHKHPGPPEIAAFLLVVYISIPTRGAAKINEVVNIPYPYQHVGLRESGLVGGRGGSV
jgi:hypothetical protein